MIEPRPKIRKEPDILSGQRFARVLVGMALAVTLAGCASDPPPPPPVTEALQPTGALSLKARREQQRAILKIRDQTLDQLFKLKPSVRTEFDQAAGYGVFEINGLNAVLAETHGRGVVLDKNNRAAYMLLARTDVGPGAEVKPYRQVLLFGNPETLNRFTTSGSPAGASSDPGITVYRLDIKGVSTQADWGARYFRDPDLN
ncbi:MAG: hypothetical protein P9E67_01810 [Candidatus Competibacter sp.]|nr:hypothetical protein [Candidatus Competibacter sp.]